MTALSGYSSTTRAKTLLGSWVIYIDGTAAYGATQGEVSVTLPHEYDNLNFDGKLGIPIAGLDRRVGGTPMIEGTFFEMDATKLADLEPAGTSATNVGLTTVTPELFGEFLDASTDYKENVRAVCRVAGGTLFSIKFPFALVIVDTLTGQSAGNGTVKLRIEARQAANAASLGVAPYILESAADLATLVSAD